MWSDADRRIGDSSLEVMAVGMTRTPGNGRRDDNVNLGPHTCAGPRELKGCRRDSLKDDKKVDTYRNMEKIYGNCST